MNKIFLFILFLFNQHLLVSQIIVPYIWTEKLELKKEKPIWLEKLTTIAEIEEGVKTEYLFSEIKFETNGKKKISFFDKKGNVKEVSYVTYEDSNTEIYESADGDREVRIFDDKENLISESWTYPDGSISEKTFIYEEGKLVKIIEEDSEDEGDLQVEELVYEGDKLSRILSLNELGEPIMERRYIYNEDGRLEEMQRIQEKELNKRVSYYYYYENNKLQYKSEETMNRLTGKKMPPEIYQFNYHDNGVVKEEKWIIYSDESKETVKYEHITRYNKVGLEISDHAKDYRDGSEELSSYEYKMR